LIDILGMWGDAVDNIPGIPGVGEKTAAKLVQQYGSMEGLYEHTEELKGKLKEKVEANKEQAFMSKYLATIITDVPIEFDEKEFTKDDPDKEKLLELFSDLEFRTLSKRVLDTEIKSTAAGTQTSLFDENGSSPEQKETQEEEVMESFKDIDSVPHEYTLVNDEKSIAALLKTLQSGKEICFDTETTGLDAMTADLVGISFAIEKEKGFYMPVPEDKAAVVKLLEPFKAIFEDDSKLLIAQNLKYDLKILHKYGIQVKSRVFDTMIAHYLLQPDMRHNMDLLAETYLNYRPVSIESLIGKKPSARSTETQKSMRDVELEKVKEYAAEDADITFQLKQKFEKGLKDEGLSELFQEIEMPLVEVLAAMEEEGIRLDTDTLARFSEELGKELDELEKDICGMAGSTFNIDSPKQLGQVLFDVLKITDKPPKTRTGQYSTSEDVLQKLKGKHDIIDKVLTYRSLKKLKSTYTDSLPNEVNEVTGRIHTTYSQTIAATGRLSSVGPNLQNIPIKTERGREIRRSFIPRNADFLLMSADYSQIELRIIAALSDDENMIRAFRNNEDIHTATAAKIFDVPAEEVDRQMRIKAKSVNFGIIYGQSAFGLAQNINISRSEAREIIDAYFEQYPKIKAYMDHSIESAKKLGYVETIKKRKRYLRDINSSNSIVRGAAERNAINAPIQGSAADVIKVAMINIHREMNKLKPKSKMLLQVHDELVFDVYKDELEDMKALVREKMEHAVELKVPLVVEMNAAGNWLEAH
jgi:DNA polymerase-1